MGQWIYYCKGYLHIRLISNMPERFLNLCANHQIPIWNLKHIDNYYEMNITVSGFYQLKPLCRKTCTRIQIQGKYGLPFFFYKNKKRTAFFVGIVLCIAVLYGMSLFIWNIHVDGNLSNSTQSIVTYLEEIDIHHGIRKSTIDCSELAVSIRKEFPDIIWVSVKIQGTRLILHVQENTDTYKEEEAVNDETPSDLVADKEGVIVSMITRQGVPQKNQGEECKKGDILVLGRLDITDDNGEAVRYQYVSADADVYIRTSYQYYHEFPLTYEKREYTGKKKSSVFFQIMDYYLSAKRKSSFKNYHSVSAANRVKLTENFYLPITYGTLTDYEYHMETYVYSNNEAVAKAEERLDQFISRLQEKEVTINENNVEIEINNTSCIAKGTLIVIEKIGKTVPVTNLEQPKIPEPESTEE